MPRPATQRSTTFALLALMGLVGGLGTGLHALVGHYDCVVRCWLEGAPASCGYNAISSRRSPASLGALAETIQTAAAISTSHECPICTLLARYHGDHRVNYLPAAIALSPDAVRAFSIAPAPPAWVECCRPRGPPCPASAS